MKDKVSSAVIQRLPRYYRYLSDLLEENVDRISSSDLAARMHVTASQIRQDLNTFGGFGQQGYGYNVFNLHEEIAKILKIDQVHSMIIVGAGHLGLALSNYTNFRKRGFDIKGVFDNNPKVIGQEAGGVKVSPMSEMKDIVEKNHIRLAALCIPKDAAVKIVDDLISYGVRGFWNFAHVDLEVPEHVVVENVHLSESLMRLSYRVFEEQ